jgi:LuxR family maltose regulon positive regulatory protein
LPPSAVIARYLLNDLETLSERFILVLDDYQHIRNAAVHDFVAELLVYPSPIMHLALLTRHDPPLPLASLRSRGLLTEIASEQLRFTVSETKSFLERFLHFAITDKTAQILEEKMEGWVTGLQLAALSIRNESDQERLTTEMLDTSQYVRDYLIQDVLSQVPPQFNRYLLQTAILNRFCAPLCDALHAKAPEQDQIEADASGRHFIDWLIKTHLFVIPLDTTNKWFRYHHLFKQLLQNQLRRHCGSEEIAALHSRAGEWFAENDLIDEAIKHALAAGDALAAAQIVERNRHAALDADRWHELGIWLDKLPHEIKQERPDLLLGQAWIQLQIARVAEIFPIIERVEALVDVDSMEPALLSEINFFKGLLCYLRDEGADSLELFTRSMEQLPKDSFVALRSEVEYWLCVALHLNGQKETAIRRLHEGICSRNLQEGMILSRLAFGLCFIHMLDGECLQAFQEGLRLREVCRSNQLAFAETWGMYVLGNTSFQMFDLDAARHHFNLVIENRYIKSPRAAIDAMAGLAITRQFMGEPDEADETMRLAQEYAQWTKDPGHLKIVHSCQARLALLRGDLDLASGWQRSLSKMPGNLMILFFLETPAITECRVLIAIGSDASLKEATERIEGLLQKSKAWYNTCQILDIMVLQVMASHRQGRLEDALDVLEQAVAMAAPGGSIRPFVELGSPMADLLKRLVAKNVAVEFIEELLAAFRGDEHRTVPDATDDESPSPPLPLSAPGRTPNKSRARCSGSAGSAAEQQRDSRKTVHFNGDCEIPPEKHLREAQRQQPP